MRLVEWLLLFYMISILGVGIYLRDLYQDITRLRNNGQGEAFAYGDGTPYMPIPFFEEYGDTEETKKLIKKRNRVSVLFCVMFILQFVFGYYVAGGVSE